MTQGITPEKIALTLAVGSACALFPILGTTTLLCLIVGVLLRLNQPAIQLVNGMCTPLHLPVILALYHFGNRLFRVPHDAAGGKHFFSNLFWIFWDHPHLFFQRFGALALHLVVAWSIIAPAWIAVVYFVALPVLREIDVLHCPRIRAAAEKTGIPPHPVP